MNLNAYRDEVSGFLKNSADSDSESDETVLKMMEEEYEQLKENLDNPNRFRHQIYDMLFLLFELAAINDFDLDAEWQRGREKKQKYIKAD